MKNYVVESVGFGGGIQQVALYENGGGTQIIAQFTGNGYEANRAAAIALCEMLRRESVISQAGRATSGFDKGA